ncbi:MAG TPA: hypothetical protein PKD16_18710, partial [Saprospiraceae bacterium]|nr:hypothetical protein [Saprospiraceae bacterium]
GNPEAGGTLIGVYRTVADIAAGNTLSGLTYTFTANNLTSLYMIVNTDQYPIMVSDTASYGIDECDYTDNVFILPAPQFTQTKQEICQGDSFDFFGQALTASGTYYHEIAAMNACDSVIVALELVVKVCQVECDPKCYGKKMFVKDAKPIAVTKLAESSFDVSQFQTPLAFDVDNDGFTEIITSSFTLDLSYFDIAKNIQILDAKSLKIKYTIPTAYYCAGGVLSVVILDINKDCVPEFIVAAIDENINPPQFFGKLICYDLAGNIVWISDKEYGTAFNNFKFGGALGVADFNNDEIPEVYIYNEIFNAQTGIKLCSGGNNGVGEGNSFGGRVANSLAINTDDNPSDLELVAGYTVYKVDIENTMGEIGNVMIPNNLVINGKNIEGLTAFADLNMDAIPEIIISSNASKTPSGLYIYKYANGIYTLLSGPEKFFPNELWDTGLPMLVKLDGATQISCILSADDKILNILIESDWSLNLKSIIPAVENSAGIGLTTFDLDGDGSLELILRDEEAIKIFQHNENNFQLSTSFPCISATFAEMPIIVALEKNGEARICVTCAEKFLDHYGRLTIFGPPPGQRWAPARNIWHQYAYNPLFINDDGTVPQYMHN